MTEKNGRVLSVVDTRRPRRTLPVKLGVNKGGRQQDPQDSVRAKTPPSYH